MIQPKVLTSLEEIGIEYYLDMPLKQRSSFRIGGLAKLAVMPDSENKLIECLRIFNRYEIPFYVIGNASNILFGDGVISRALIFTKKICDITVDKNNITAGCGTSLASLASTAAEHALTGLEFASGIPATVGGGVFMNAGAYGSEMSDVLIKSTAFDVDSGDVINITDHVFAYRSSIYANKKQLVCLRGSFELSMGDPKAIYAKMKELSKQRKDKQPLEYPSAGSYFKRPNGYFAAKLIDDCGLKGYSVGGASVSEKHAGFIINLGGATAEDVLRLEDHVRKTVYDKFGVELEREVRLIM